MKTCVICNSNVSTILDLREQPLANNLLEKVDDPYDKFPLGLDVCETCGHAQLSHFVDPGLLFKDYLYASGTSQTLGAYFEWFADGLSTVIPVGGRVLEIASNDGSLLRRLANRGLETVGVDPAANLSAVAQAAGLNVLTGFFPEVSPEGKFDAIVAMNVAAHTPTPLQFMRGVAASLADDGVAIIQTSQAMMIPNGEFDTIYHEHYSFYSVSSMERLATECGLALVQVQLVSVHGTSFLFFLRHAGKGPVQFPQTAPFAVEWQDTQSSFQSFATKANDLMNEVSQRVKSYRERGFDLALVGVAAKALTFVHAANLAPDWYFDEAPLKVNRFVPGSSTPIRPFSDLALLSKPTVLLLGAWNFADELRRKIDSLNLRGDHVYLVHLPTVREFEIGTIL